MAVPGDCPRPSIEGTPQLYCPDNEPHRLTLHWTSRWLPNSSAASRETGVKNHLAHKPSLSQREQEGSSWQKMASQDTKPKLPTPLPSTSLLLSRGLLHTLSCKYLSVGKTEDISGSVGGVPADPLEARRVHCCLRQLHFPPPLLHVGEWMFRQIC